MAAQTAEQKKAAADKAAADKAAADKADADKAAADKAAADKADADKGTTILKFSAPYKAWSNGDIASFDDKKAEEILSLKPAVAEEYKAEE